MEKRNGGNVEGEGCGHHYPRRGEFVAGLGIMRIQTFLCKFHRLLSRAFFLTINNPHEFRPASGRRVTPRGGRNEIKWNARVYIRA